MINFDYYVNENKTEPNPEWLYIPDHPCIILIMGVLDREKQIHY